MKNILLLNAGTRNVLVRDFKKTANGELKIVVTDNYNLAPSLYEADKYYITPWIDQPNYWDEVERICDAENIGLIISLIDPELEILAKEKAKFEKKGILLNVCDYDVIHGTYDKYELLEFIRKHGFSWIKTYSSVDTVLKAIDEGILNYPLFKKPMYGSGSKGIAKINNKEELLSIIEEGDIIQEFFDGHEIGVDVYIDLISEEVVSIFAKRKLKMRAGETDKSVSFKDDKLFELISRFAKEYGLRGANDIDVFERDGEYYISEVNPRFGGGYIHAYECGVDFPKMLINNMNGFANKKVIGDYKEDVYMMKYFDIKMLGV